MIITFSGTGNSFYISSLLKNALNEKEEIKLQGENLLLNDPTFVLDDSHKHVVWVFPTYSWGVPPILVKYLNRCRIISSRNVIHHLVVTCGDDVGNLVQQWDKILKSKGWQRGGVWSVQMPNIYVCLPGFNVDSKELEDNKIRHSTARVKEIVNKLLESDWNVDVVKGSFPFIKSKIIYPVFRKLLMNPKHFKTLNNCISCGLCKDQCPTQNIRMFPENDLMARPVWNDNCAFCLRCYHNCPVKAIQYGKETKNKGQYIFPGYSRRLI